MSSGRSTAVALLAMGASLGAAACNKDKEAASKLERHGDKANVVVVNAPSAHGELVDEVEPNNEAASAQAFTLGGGVKGSLDGSEDVDVYGFQVETEGLLFAVLSGIDDADLVLELRDGSDALLASSDRGPKKTVEGVAGYRLLPGQAYRLVVREFIRKRDRKKGGRVGPSATYELSAKLQASADENFESEPNEGLDGAMELSPGVDRFGYLGWSNDQDLWRLPVAGMVDVAPQLDGSDPDLAASKTGLDIVVSGVSRVDLRLDLLGPDESVLASRQGSTGQELALRTFVPDVGKDFYLLRISGKRSNPEESYSISVSSKTLEVGSEEELNDRLEDATVLPVDLSGVWSLSGEVCMGDVDHFRVPPATVDRVLNLELSGPSDADLDVSLVSEAGAVLSAAQGSEVGAREILPPVTVAANSSPLVRVSAKKVGAPARYQLHMNLVEGRVPPPPLPGGDDGEDATVPAP